MVIVAFAADFGRTAQDYCTFRAGFPPELLVRLRAFNIGLPVLPGIFRYQMNAWMLLWLGNAGAGLIRSGQQPKFAGFCRLKERLLFAILIGCLCREMWSRRPKN
jgi:hypothetical protein